MVNETLRSKLACCLFLFLLSKFAFAAEWQNCAAENGHCNLPNGQTATVRYGAANTYAIKTGVSGSIACNNRTFGDPKPGIAKKCEYRLEDDGSSSPHKGLVVVPSPGPSATAINAVIQEESDAVENEVTGRINHSSSDLELGFDSAQQVVGLRFVGLAIPPKAKIEYAHIQFTSKGGSDGFVSYEVGAPPVANAPVFSKEGQDVRWRDILSPLKVTWVPERWNSDRAAGPSQRTPDISRLIQKIVDVDGWSAGNAIAFTFKETIGQQNYRRAYSDGNSSIAPKLFVIYSGGEVSQEATETYIHCADQGGRCVFPNGQDATVKYGANGLFRYKYLPASVGSLDCNGTQMGDPAPGVTKRCYYRTGQDSKALWAQILSGTQIFGGSGSQPGGSSEPPSTVIIPGRPISSGDVRVSIEGDYSTRPNVGDDKLEYAPVWGAKKAFRCSADQFLVGVNTNLYGIYRSADRVHEMTPDKGIGSLDFTCASLLVSGKTSGISEQSSDARLKRDYGPSYLGRDVINSYGSKVKYPRYLDYDYVAQARRNTKLPRTSASSKCDGIASGVVTISHKSRILVLSQAHGRPQYGTGYEDIDKVYETQLWCAGESDGTLTEHVAEIKRQLPSGHNVEYQECPSGHGVVGARPFFHEISGQLTHVTLNCAPIKSDPVVKKCLDYSEETGSQSVCHGIQGYRQSHKLVKKIYDDMWGRSGGYDVASLYDSITGMLYRGTSCYQVVADAAVQSYNDPSSYFELCPFETQEEERLFEVLTGVCPEEGGLDDCRFINPQTILIKPSSFRPDIDRGPAAIYVIAGVGALVTPSGAKCQNRNNREVDCFLSDRSVNPEALVQLKTPGGEPGNGDVNFLHAQPAFLYADHSYNWHQRQIRWWGQTQYRNESRIDPVLIDPKYANQDIPEGTITTIDMVKQDCWEEREWPTDVWGRDHGSDDCLKETYHLRAQKEWRVKNKAQPTWRRTHANLITPRMPIYDLRDAGYLGRTVFYGADRPFYYMSAACEAPEFPNQWKEYIAGETDNLTINQADLEGFTCGLTWRDYYVLATNLAADEKKKTEKQQIIADIVIGVASLGAGGVGAVRSVAGKALTKAALKFLERAIRTWILVETTQALATVFTEAVLFTTHRVEECATFSEASGGGAEQYVGCLKGAFMAAMFNVMFTDLAPASAGRLLLDALQFAQIQAKKTITKRALGDARNLFSEVEVQGMVKNFRRQFEKVKGVPARKSVDFGPNSTKAIKERYNRFNTFHKKYHNVSAAKRAESLEDIAKVRQSLKNDVDELLSDFNNVFTEDYAFLRKWGDDFKKSIDEAPDGMFYLKSTWKKLSEKFDIVQSRGFSRDKLDDVTSFVKGRSDILRNIPDDIDKSFYEDDLFVGFIEDVLDDPSLSPALRRQLIDDTVVTYRRIQQQGCPIK